EVTVECQLFLPILTMMNVSGNATGPGVVYSCCTKVSTADVTDPILNIRLQHESLPCVKAVIFKTKRGEFCIDPKQRWVEKKVKQNKRLTSTPPPTSSISHQTHVGGATQATDSSSVTNV
uniref:Chemokine interleukin-8-like domain-containing protein n=1 Tax=Cyprinus carpio TaxID=7962 RepID=A0A8C1IIK1_CYPCA